MNSTKAKRDKINPKEGGTVQRQVNELPNNLRKRGTVQRKRNVRLR